MTDLQEKLLELLCEIDEICRKHDIEYALFAGTALGAERHKGFVPWDDDADIIMTRENYEKFLEVAPKEMKKDRTLNCLEDNPKGYFFSYARYVDLSTTAIQRHTAFGGCDPGIKIDIFVVVPTFSNLKLANRHRQQILAFSEAICKYGIMYSFRDKSFFPLYRKEKQLLNRIGREDYIKKRVKQLKKSWIKNPKRYLLFSGTMSDSYILDKDIVEKVKCVPFENTELLISEKNVAFSKELYGEGWINVPANIEKPRHTMLLDTKNPYGPYLEVMKNADSYEWGEQVVAKRREVHLQEREEFDDVVNNRQHIKNLITEMSVTKAYQNAKTENMTSWTELFAVFKPYFKMQLNHRNRYFKQSITLPMDVFEKALTTALKVGYSDWAMETIKIGLASGYLTKSLYDKYFVPAEFLISLTECVCIEKNSKKAQEMLAQLPDTILEDSASVCMTNLWLHLQEAQTAKEREQIQKELQELHSTYEEVGEIVLLMGMCEEALGMSEKAKETYHEAIKTVRNAFAFQWLLERGCSWNDD